MVSLDGSVVIQIINFVVLIFVLNAVLYRPIREALIKRKDSVSNFEKNIQSLTDIAKEKELSFNESLKKARVNGLKEKEVLLGNALKKERELINQINQKNQAEFAKICEKVAQDVKNVENLLTDKIDDFANEITFKILGRAN